MAEQRLPDCRACKDSIDLDETALVLVDEAAEVLVAGCDAHLRRVVLALEVLDALEKAERFEVPPLIDVVFKARLTAEPERRIP